MNNLLVGDPQVEALGVVDGLAPISMDSSWKKYI